MRVTVMGLGRFGGGAGATRWLLERGAHVTLTDLRTQHDLSEQLAALPISDRLTLRLGAHAEADFADADAVVVNPAVPRPWENRYVRGAIEGGAVVTTEIRLALERLPSGVTTVGVTGSAGKSTTTSMLHQALDAAWPSGRVHLAGNIGGSLLDTIDDVRAGDALVLELSSAQLWWLSHEPRWTPDVALVTNLIPNHLDWHASLEYYESSKRAIVGGRLACHAGPIERWGEGAEVRTTEEARLDAFARPPMTLPGRHNAQNAALAELGALWALESVEACTEERAAFVEAACLACEGLDHRLRTLGVAGGVRIVDDSKCTTPEGVRLAIDAFTGARVHLICGGADKGVNLSALVDAARSCANVLCIGTTGPTIAAGLDGAEVCEALERAVERAHEGAQAGDVLLLSPGCASWDQFPHYIARAEAFRAAVERVFGSFRG